MSTESFPLSFPPVGPTKVHLCHLQSYTAACNRYPPYRGRYFRPGTRCRNHYGQALHLPQCRHTVGQPRYFVDGAAAGNDSCIANVVRMSMRYGNHATLEDGYGINLVPLAIFAIEHYKDDPCTYFVPKGLDGEFTAKTRRLLAQMHKAISIIQFKLESQLILAHPDFKMDDRLLLDKIDYERGVLKLMVKNIPCG